jgi:hypothetical protein
MCQDTDCLSQKSRETVPATEELPRVKSRPSPPSTISPPRTEPKSLKISRKNVRRRNAQAQSMSSAPPDSGPEVLRLLLSGLVQDKMTRDRAVRMRSYIFNFTLIVEKRSIAASWVFHCPCKSCDRPILHRDPWENDYLPKHLRACNLPFDDGNINDIIIRYCRPCKLAINPSLVHVLAVVVVFPQPGYLTLL